MDPALERGIEELSKEKSWSINRTAAYLMRKGLGLTDESSPHMIGDKIDHVIGKWTLEEAAQINSYVEENFGKIDEEMWR